MEWHRKNKKKNPLISKSYTVCTRRDVHKILLGWSERKRLLHPVSHMPMAVQRILSVVMPVSMRLQLPFVFMVVASLVDSFARTTPYVVHCSELVCFGQKKPRWKEQVKLSTSCSSLLSGIAVTWILNPMALAMSCFVSGVRKDCEHHHQDRLLFLIHMTAALAAYRQPMGSLSAIRCILRCPVTHQAWACNVLHKVASGCT